jgi:hypothetical protein
MTEYDQLCCILSEEFLSVSQDVMIENKENTHKTQCVNIDDGNRKGLTRKLYRFDLEEKEFLPFFNKTDYSPEGLRKFCDYLLLVEYKGRTYILLVELKRGDTFGADKQLRASESFIEFLCKTAKRLHDDFGDFNFDPQKIVLRKIIIKACKSNKTEIHPRQIDKNQDIIPFKSSGIFPLARFL